MNYPFESIRIVIREPISRNIDELSRLRTITNHFHDQLPNLRIVFSPEQQNKTTNSNKLTPQEFNAIPVSIMNSQLQQKLKNSSPKCPICIETIKTGSECTLLPCGHVYHKNCAQKWLTEKCKRPTCPMCRADVRTK